MYRYRIDQLTLNDGTKLLPGNLVVIVGPNNVGKSRALRDLISLCAPQYNAPAIRPVIVTSAEWPTPSSVKELIARKKWYVRDEPNGIRMLRSLDPSLAGERAVQVSGIDEQDFSQIRENSALFGSFVGSQFIGHLSTQTRLSLVQQIQSPQWAQHAQNLMHNIYAGGRNVEQEIDRVSMAQFGVHAAFDFSALVHLLFRVAADLPEIPEDPREAAPILEKLERLDDQGDGIRAFLGIFAALVCAHRDVFLIDEPEAFLHPPQAFRMGEILAEKASHSLQIFVATHSADVLQGIISKTSDVTVLRIDRLGDVNAFRVLEQADLKALISDPLLRSARVLDGLFYPAALVVEADSDARLYHVASRRLSEKFDLYTVNAQNKQTVARIQSLYRKLGIRSAGLVDFDVLNDENEFKKQVQSLTSDSVEQENLRMLRRKIADSVEKSPSIERASVALIKLGELNAALVTLWAKDDNRTEELAEQVLKKLNNGSAGICDQAKPWAAYKENGRDALEPSLQAVFDELASITGDLGLIINPFGELESLLVDQGIAYTTNKQLWIQSALVLLPNLQVDETKRLWKLISDVHGRVRSL